VLTSLRPESIKGFVSNLPFVPAVSAIIVIIKEYRGAIVSALDNVMKISGNGNSRQSGDAASRALSIQ
jgi:hypothetical protein